MMLGKFLPPHLGHCYLADFARHYCDELTILVCTLEREPIPGSLRFEWMRRIFPDCRVIHITDDVPQTPDEHPEFWPIWRALVLGAMPDGVDYVFASEDYGFKLAEVLDAEYIPVDHAREMTPISGTKVREEPMKYWDFIPREVQPYFLRRVCIFGPESSGKSTLARDLAQYFHTQYVHEYARPLLDFKDGRCDWEDIERIARGQAAAEDALAGRANRVLFCDTDPLLTTIWSDVFFGKCPEWVTLEAARRQYDLYLLLDVDVPWVDDGQRYFPDELKRREFFKRCERELIRRERPFVRISGDWNERFKRAVNAVENLINAPAAQTSPSCT